jgi:hypothetical protein
MKLSYILLLVLSSSSFPREVTIPEQHCWFICNLCHLQLHQVVSIHTTTSWVFIFFNSMWLFKSSENQQICSKTYRNWLETHFFWHRSIKPKHKEFFFFYDLGEVHILSVFPCLFWVDILSTLIAQGSNFLIVDSTVIGAKLGLPVDHIYFIQIRFKFPTVIPSWTPGRY